MSFTICEAFFLPKNDTMVKYRLLSNEELNELEQEFIKFLILNGIAADDWKAIKEKHPQKAMRMIELFSDVVFDRIMRKTQFLERREKKELKALQCLADKFVLVGLNASKINEADFTSPDYFKAALNHPPEELEIYTLEMKYGKSREEAVFDMTEKGFVISDGKLFKTLCLALADS